MRERSNEVATVFAQLFDDGVDVWRALAGALRAIGR